MNELLTKLKTVLEEGGYTCVLSDSERTLTSKERGILPLVLWLENGEELRGFSAADKIVGKAAAMLYVCMGVRAVHAAVLAEEGLKMLEKYGIETEYDVLTPHIVNRAGDGVCPMERAVSAVSDPAAGRQILKSKVLHRE